MDTWRSSMLHALAATLGRPAWWSMALAAFLIRGGLLLVVLPIVALPSPAELETAFSPTVSSLVFGGLTTAVLLAIFAAVLVVLAVLGGVGLAGAWLDRELLREAAADDDLDLTWAPVHASLREALALRLAGHLPTLAALAYATFRLIAAGYDELMSPGDVAIPLVLRIVERAPDAAIALVAAWLLGEAVGGLAARRAAAGASFGTAYRLAARQLLSSRGLATLTVTTAAVAVALAPFLLAVGRASEQLRVVLLGSGDVGYVAAALLVLIAAWILGLAVLGAALAWRAAAWTAEIAPAMPASSGGSAIAATATEAQVMSQDRHASAASSVEGDTLGRIPPLL
jgi:hypothetical protein